MHISLESIVRPTRDIIAASKTMSINEVRFMVDAYYQIQEYRKAANNQAAAIDRGADDGPIAESETGARHCHATLDWLYGNLEVIEGQIARALDAYSQSHEIGPWLQQVYGIGAIIRAGLIAHLDVAPWRCRNPLARTRKQRPCKPSAPCTPDCSHERIETVGHWWRFAGLDPTSRWERGGVRPHNARLKVLCWKIGQSFMKFSSRSECYYGRIYRERKAYELARNESGGNAAAARALLDTKPTHAQRAIYAQGKLPAGQIDARARRYAVKLFLSHLHHAWYEVRFGEPPPKPYPIAQLGHAHFIAPPGINDSSIAGIGGR